MHEPISFAAEIIPPPLPPPPFRFRPVGALGNMLMQAFLQVGWTEAKSGSFFFLFFFVLLPLLRATNTDAEQEMEKGGGGGGEEFPLPPLLSPPLSIRPRRSSTHLGI